MPGVIASTPQNGICFACFTIARKRLIRYASLGSGSLGLGGGDDACRLLIHQLA